jgi:hypothetical protein
MRESGFIRTEGISLPMAIKEDESLRYQDRIRTVLWKAYSTDGAISILKETLRL